MHDRQIIIGYIICVDDPSGIELEVKQCVRLDVIFNDADMLISVRSGLFMMEADGVS